MFISVHTSTKSQKIVKHKCVQNVKVEHHSNFFLVVLTFSSVNILTASKREMLLRAEMLFTNGSASEKQNRHIFVSK